MPLLQKSLSTAPNVSEPCTTAATSKPNLVHRKMSKIWKLLPAIGWIYFTIYRYIRQILFTFQVRHVRFRSRRRICDGSLFQTVISNFLTIHFEVEFSSSIGNGIPAKWSATASLSSQKTHSSARSAMFVSNGCFWDVFRRIRL
jgi:hypothetical protein